MLLKLRLLLEILGQPALWQRLFSARWGLVLFPALLGLITSCGFAPVGLWPLTLAGLSLSAALLAHYQTKKQIFVSSLSFFTAFSAASLWWLNFVLQGFGAMPVPLAWTVLLIFALYLALPYALLSVLARKLAGSRRGIFLFCFLPPAWCLADLIIGVLFGGFPWVYAGYTALTGPLSAFAPLIGVRGINLCFYLCAGAVALALFHFAHAFLCGFHLGFLQDAQQVGKLLVQRFALPGLIGKGQRIVLAYPRHVGDDGDRRGDHFRKLHPFGLHERLAEDDGQRALQRLHRGHGLVLFGERADLPQLAAGIG